MGLFARFLRYSVDTYGGAPLLLLINLVQIAILGWVVSQALRAQAERVAPGVSSEARRIRAARRAEIWQKQVRPVAMTMMLLGPGLGLGMSTLVGALGMGALGDAMGTQAGAEVLAQTMARAYREISYAYFLMVGGTFPMLLGPVIVNILLFHIFLEPSGLPLALVVAVLALFLLGQVGKDQHGAQIAHTARRRARHQNGHDAPFFGKNLLAKVDRRPTLPPQAGGQVIAKVRREDHADAGAG